MITDDDNDGKNGDDEEIFNSFSLLNSNPARPELILLLAFTIYVSAEIFS